MVTILVLSAGRWVRTYVAFGVTADSLDLTYGIGRWQHATPAPAPRPVAPWVRRLLDPVGV